MFAKSFNQDTNLVSPTGVVDASGSTGGLAFASGTTAQRPTSPTVGMSRWNTTLYYAEIWNGAEWLRYSSAPVTPTVDYLIVAGGGGGATDIDVGGGGGGGGLLTGSIIRSFQTYAIVVGGGGPRGTGVDNTGTGGGSAGTQGASSSFNSLVAIGGGAGGTRNQNGGVGGSGGGGGDNGNVGGAGTAGQGYAGGTGPGMNSNAGNDSGGGGGAGGAASFNIPGSGLYNAVANAYFAAGGSGAQLMNPVDSVANTGNGGTGARAGGSGVVVIRYANSYAAAIITTGSPIVTNASGYYTYTFIASGSITF